MILINLDDKLHFVTNSLAGYEVFKNPDTSGSSKVEYFGFNKKQKTVYVQTNKFASSKSYIVIGVPEDIIEVYNQTKPDIDKYISEWLSNKEKNRAFTFAEQTDMKIVPAENAEVVKHFSKLQHDKLAATGLWACDKHPNEVFRLFYDKYIQAAPAGYSRENLLVDWDEFCTKYFNQL